jgi:hypothetical protein
MQTNLSGCTEGEMLDWWRNVTPCFPKRRKVLFSKQVIACPRVVFCKSLYFLLNFILDIEVPFSFFNRLSETWMRNIDMKTVIICRPTDEIYQFCVVSSMYCVGFGN